ncbi:hypothetical protein TRIP_E100008 [uncultured Spirochaetota bacterium]|nr:hypothetical protein TRIP_E100008 [uncultured Spirochaetota bacterium]
MIKCHVLIYFFAGVVDEKGKDRDSYDAGYPDGNALELRGELVVEIGHLKVAAPAEGYGNAQEGYPDKEVDHHFLAEGQAFGKKVAIDHIDEGDERHDRQEKGA